jgi:hypothetical protein
MQLTMIREMKMNKVWKDKWVKALRSGRYKQAQGTLEVSGVGANCCLGVLCRIAGVKKIIRVEHGTISDIGNKVADGEGFGVVGLSLLKKFGLRQSTEDKLVQMNDSQGLTFNQIASYISRNL